MEDWSLSPLLSPLLEGIPSSPFPFSPLPPSPGSLPPALPAVPALSLPSKGRGKARGKARGKVRGKGRACDRCRMKKVKCVMEVVGVDGEEVCARCIRDNLRCTFVLPRRKSGPRKRKAASSGEEEAEKEVGEEEGGEKEGEEGAGKRKKRKGLGVGVGAEGREKRDGGEDGDEKVKVGAFKALVGDLVPWEALALEGRGACMKGVVDVVVAWMEGQSVVGRVGLPVVKEWDVETMAGHGLMAILAGGALEGGALEGGACASALYAAQWQLAILSRTRMVLSPLPMSYQVVAFFADLYRTVGSPGHVARMRAMAMRYSRLSSRTSLPALIQIRSRLPGPLVPPLLHLAGAVWNGIPFPVPWKVATFADAAISHDALMASLAEIPLPWLPLEHRLEDRELEEEEEERVLGSLAADVSASLASLLELEVIACECISSEISEAGGPGEDGVMVTKGLVAKAFGVLEETPIPILNGLPLFASRPLILLAMVVSTRNCRVYLNRLLDVLLSLFPHPYVTLLSALLHHQLALDFPQESECEHQVRRFQAQTTRRSPVAQ